MQADASAANLVGAGPWTISAAAWDCAGVSVETAADGLMRARIERLTVRDVKATRGDDALRVASAELIGVTATLSTGTAPSALHAVTERVRDGAITKLTIAGVEGALTLPAAGGATLHDLR